MKAVVLMVGLALLSSTILSGCVVVPAGGWGWYGHGRGAHHYQGYPSPPPGRYGR